MTTKHTSRESRPAASAKEGDPLRPLFEELVEPTGREEFDTLRARLSHMHHLRGSLEGSGSNTNEGAKPMKKHWRRALTWTAAACLLLAVVACTVPMEYERETGMDLRLAVRGSVEELVQELRSQGWGVDQLQITPLEEGLQSLDLVLLGARESDLAQIQQMPGVVSLDAEVLTETAEGTLYDMMMHEVFHISIDVTGMSDEEIAAEVTNQLAASGLAGNVRVETDENGLYNFEFEFDEDDSLPEGAVREFQIELQSQEELHEGDPLPVLGSLGLDAEDLANMTQEEIDTFVRQQLAAQGVDVQDVEIEVLRDSTAVEGQVRKMDKIWISR